MDIIKNFLFKILLISVTLFVCVFVYADNPKINIQGRLTTDYGDPIKNKDISIEIKEKNGSTFIINSSSTTTDSEGLYDVDVVIKDDITISSETEYTLIVKYDNKSISKNFNFSHVPFSIYSSTATYAVNASTAIYAISMSSTGSSGQVWGIDSDGKQDWINADIKVTSASYADVAARVSTVTTTDNFCMSENGRIC